MVLSAKRHILDLISPRSLIYFKKRDGSRMEPKGTPEVIEPM